jgi:phage baseplate assembly protein W
VNENTKSFLGVGPSFPFIQLDSNSNIKTSQYEEKIKESIIIILGTSKGERLMRPNFGCGIHDFVFETINTSILTRIKLAVSEALVLWEPRINLLNVDVSTQDIKKGILTIKIEYQVRTTNNQFNLVYPFFLKESS